MVWGLIAALFLGNLMLLIMNITTVGLFVRVLMVPPHILMPTVAMIGFVGIFSISGSAFDLFLMIIFGVVGYVLRKLEVPLVPVILGILLGNQMEDNLRRALQISNGDWSILWGSPIAIGPWIAAFVGFVAPLLVGNLPRPRRLAPADATADPDLCGLEVGWQPTFLLSRNLFAHCPHLVDIGPHLLLNCGHRPLTIGIGRHRWRRRSATRATRRMRSASCMSIPSGTGSGSTACSWMTRAARNGARWTTMTST